MLCQKCHKNVATARYAEVVDGQVTEQQLCAECLLRHQHDSAIGFELAGPTPGLHRHASKEAEEEPPGAAKTCPGCGLSFATIHEKARVGCPACYESFGRQIESILEGLHRALQHKGKLARVEDSRTRLRADLQAKRALLRSVLRAENYEEAARLRDEIRGIEEGMHMAESGED